jgi:two-component system nitrogen regulation response regulator NtrX
MVLGVLPVESGPRPGGASPASPSAPHESLTDTLDEHERTLIVHALSAAGGNVAEASRRLKTDRANLYRRMRRLDIPVGDE